MRRAVVIPIGILAIVLAAPGRAAAQHQHDEGDPPRRLGTVRFATSCDPSVQPEFDRAVALLHSFWFSAAIDGFNAVLAKDSACAMAHWGVAMSWWSNPFGGFRPPAALAAGRKAVEQARAAGPKTARERDYIEAAAELYKDYETVDQRTRILNYERAMERLAATHTSDPEARIFYALALDQAALPTDHTYARQLKAGAILEQELSSQPDHPGITHYIIHSYDVPPLAPRALDAARRYAKIAPDAPHALHMPSHTFTRVGYWEESIETNIASAASARKVRAASEELHALDYQVYAYLQLARDAEALEVREAIAPIGARIEEQSAGNAAPAPAGYYALAAIPARYALERHAWAEAAALQARDTPYLWADAVSYFARALGAARSGEPAAAAPDIDKLASIGAALEAKKEGYWAGQVDIQRRVAAAWARYAEGRKDEGLAMLREAADMEDATEKSAVTPGPITPAREQLGEMLLAMERPAEALAAFEQTMRKEPNRFRAVYGAATAAEAAGEREKARKYYGQVVELGRAAEAPIRPELQDARRKAGR